MDEHFFLLEEKKWIELDELYHEKLFQKEEMKDYLVTKDQSHFIGKILRVESDGKLIIETKDQLLLGFYMKEIIFK